MGNSRLPQTKGVIYNTTKAEGTDFFASDLVPSQDPTTFMIYYRKGSGGTGSGFPSIRRINGSNVVMEDISPGSSGPGLNISRIIVTSGDTINIVSPTGRGSQVVDYLAILEVETLF